jgi:calreticulin
VADVGAWRPCLQLSHGKHYGDAQLDLGIQTSQDARFYAISSKLAEPFTNKGDTLVVQFTVKHEQNLDCGGGYIKLLPATLEPKKFDGDSPYYIMFGPDICGTKRTHVIFNHNGENKLIKDTIQPSSDIDTHVYTLVVKPDQTYQVLIDNVEKKSGTLEADWDFLAPKTIKDPAASKPADWDDNPKIDDPTDVKPADWDDKPEFIPDPAATKPEDWDDDLDGEWEPAKVRNPEYQGAWRPKRIDNPNYKGAWVHPLIPNPEYAPDPNLGVYANIGAVGFDLWQVKSGSIFDNVIVTNSVDEAKAFYDETTGKTLASEQAARKAFQDEETKRLAEEEKQREAAAKASAGDDDSDDDDDDDDKDEL